MKFYEERIKYSEIKPYQLELWSWFLGGSFQIGKRFKNPERNDDNPGAILKEKNGLLLLFDPASNYHSMTVVTAISNRYNCSIGRSLQIAYYEGLENINLNKPIEKKVKTKIPFLIKYKKRKWLLKDKCFWDSVGITSKQLDFEKCFPISMYWITNKKGIFNQIKPKINVYANIINSKVKLYGPEERLFSTNFTSKEIGGFISFKDKELLIITMNLKSYLVISNLGYNCRYVPSESSLLPKKFVEEISDFKRVVLFMDFDQGGILYTQRLIDQIGCEAIFYNIEETYVDCFGNVKKCSDAYDITFKHGIDYFKEFLKNIL